jgi:cytochrome c oxidase subunit 2
MNRADLEGHGMLFGQSVQLFPESASTLAEEVDGLFFFILAVTLFFTLLIATLILVFLVKYRRRSGAPRPPHIHGSLALEATWTIIPLLIALGIFVWGARVFVIWATPPEDALEVYVVGRQWMWHLQHTGGQREINQLHVPIGRPVKLTLTSQDVVHSFFVPAFRLHRDAIPGRYTNAWFQATKTGRFRLYCSEYCGTNHSSMIGEVIVMDREAYREWLARGADDSLATKGSKLFRKLQCVACHSADSRAKAPLLEDLYLRRVDLNDGTRVRADEDYLRESIRNPSAKIVLGFQAPSIMPPFDEDLVDEEEMIQLIAFLRSLGPGETPPRVENAAPPAINLPPAKEPQGKKQ